MLRGLITLLALFALGIFLFSRGMPGEFAHLREFAHIKYQHMSELLSEKTTLPSSITIPQPSMQTQGENGRALPSFPSRGDTASLGALDIGSIVEETNKERIENHLEPLRINENLILSAELKTKDMVTLQYFEHTSPGGESVSDLGRKMGYDYLIMGENLALGNFENAHELLAAWMASPGHRANILNPRYQEIGVYAIYAEYQGNPVWFAVQHFGTQKNVCPVISTQLKNDISSTNARLTFLESEIEKKKNEIDAMPHHGSDYEKRVGEYNDLIEEYNRRLALSKQKIDQYNAQVNAFNRCLAQYQTS